MDAICGVFAHILYMLSQRRSLGKEVRAGVGRRRFVVDEAVALCGTQLHLHRYMRDTLVPRLPVLLVRDSYSFALPAVAAPDGLVDIPVVTYSPGCFITPRAHVVTVQAVKTPLSF